MKWDFKDLMKGKVQQYKAVSLRTKFGNKLKAEARFPSGAFQKVNCITDWTESLIWLGFKLVNFWFLGYQEAFTCKNSISA